MSKFYIDAGTTYSKIIEVCEDGKRIYSAVPSKDIPKLKFEASCGHMGNAKENEIIALAQGVKSEIEPDSTVLDLGSRDAKWIRFKDDKFFDMDWNTSCASSTGATVEMLLKFYDIKPENLKFSKEKYNVTCGIFGLEKIMDDISKGIKAEDAVAKFIHGIAFNAWTFAQKPKKLYLSGGFCENECFVKSLEKYTQVALLGRFKLCEGLINDKR